MSRARLSPMSVAVVGLGGALGGAARYAVLTAWPYERGSVPWSVLASNVLGCLLVGVLATMFEQRPARHPLARPFLGVGFLGGFTTFSTYALDTADLWRADQPYLAVGYLGGTLVTAMVAVVAGMAAGAGNPATASEGQMTVAAVAVGAAIGAQLRFLAEWLLVGRRGSSIPWGTLAVNVVGSFVLGLLAAVSITSWAAAGLRCWLCGGMTTYSTFGYETVHLLRSGSTGLSLLNATANVGGGMVAVSLGLLVGMSLT